MPAAAETLLIEQGATFTLYLQWLDTDDAGVQHPRDLTGVTVRLRLADDFDEPALVQIDGTDPTQGTVTLGLSPEGVTDLTSGWIAVTMSAATTSMFEDTLRYVLDAIEGSYVTRLMRGTATVADGIGPKVTT